MALVDVASSTATASVIRGDIMRPAVGVWTADLVIDQPDGTGFDPGTQVKITSGDNYSLTGIVDPNRQGDFLDAVHVRVLGGAGGLVSKEAKARNFIQPGAFVRDVLNALCTDSGETLSGTIDPGFLQTNLAAWSIVGGTSLSRCLKALLEIVAPDFSWRMLPDGTLWIGKETWTQATATYDILRQDPADGSFHIGSESPFVEPGTSLSDVGNISRVNDNIIDGKMRSRVWVDIPGTDRGINDATQRMARQAFPLIDYFTKYDAKVVAQSADGATVDLQPTDVRLSGFQRVPLKLGLPGCVAKFAPGTLLRLGWNNGNPESPYACLFDGGETLISLQLGGTHPLPIWDTYENALTAFVTAMQTFINAIVVPTGILAPAQATAAAACATLLGEISAKSFDSLIVSNG